MLTKEQIYREAMMLKEMGIDAIATMIERYERHVESLQINQDAMDVIGKLNRYLYQQATKLQNENINSQDVK